MKTRRNVLVGLLIVIFLTGLSSLWAGGEPEEAPQEVEAVEPPMGGAGLPDLNGRTVVAVTGNDYTPLNFIDPATGEAVGWEYDAVNEAGRRLNCKIDWRVSSWDTMIAAVHNGQFDVGMDGITITEERKKQVDFSIAYMVSQQFMLVQADETRFTNPKEFGADEKLLIGSQAGTTNFWSWWRKGEYIFV